MNVTHTQLLLQEFNSLVTKKQNCIEEKELKILYALSDLLEEKNLQEEKFVNHSLEYLKNHYGVNKSVWKVLLNLYEDVPDFLEKLSNRVYTEFLNTNHFQSVEEYDLGCTIIEYGHGDTPRQYGMKKLFYFISLLTKNFSVEDTCNYVGLFIKELDNKKNALFYE